MPEFKKLRDNGETRSTLIEFLMEELGRKADGLADWLENEFWSDFEKLNGTAAQRITGVNRSGVWDRFYQKSKELANWILDNLGDLVGFLKGYFSELLGTKAATDVEKLATNMLNRLGYDGKKFTKGGYFANLINDVTAERRVKRLAIQAIMSGKELGQFRKELRAVINGDKKAGRAGVVRSHYQTNAGTTFAEFDRGLSNEMAERYELTHAVWSGPRLTTSRGFCLTKKGKVFSRKDIEAMDAQQWQGKIPGQSTIISAGGYNCVDILLWITEPMAKELGYEKG